MSNVILQFENLEAGYNGRYVLRRITGSVQQRGRVAIIGPNGCGKSTLLKSIMGVLPAKGQMTFAGADIQRIPSSERNQLGIGCLRQGVNIFPSLSARVNLEMAFAGSPKAFRVRLDEILAHFPTLNDSLDRRAGLFSGGHRQALALAMVLMNRPKLLLLDEPFAGLSPKAANELLETLDRIYVESGLAWMIVEHRLPLLRRVVDWVWIMRDGQTVHTDDNPAILEDSDQLARHYLM